MTDADAWLIKTLRAVSSPVRLSVLDALKDPARNYPPQVDGDLILDGVCADFIRDRLGLAAATVSRHLTLLVDAGLLIPTRQKGWTFYRRDEDAIRSFMARFAASL